MVRLHLFAEGDTEQTFADTVLKPHLANLGVYMQKPTLIAHARKKGIVHRGGGRNFRAMQNDIDRRRKQESGNDVFFTTMIDLYALPTKFPGVEEAEKLRLDPYKRVEALEKSWFDETEKLLSYSETFSDGNFYHGDTNHIFGGLGADFKIFGQASKSAQPSQGAFDNPAFGNHLESVRRFSGDIDA